jgi:phosphoglycolate phosphatase
MFTVLLEDPDSALLEEAVALYRQRYANDGIYETRLYDGIVPMLDRVQPAASSMYVVTSKPSVFAREIVKHLGIGGYFDGVFGPELDGRYDDKAELLSHLFGSEKIQPTDALMVGDRAADVIAATANGILAVGVLWGYGSEPELTEAGAEVLCRTPVELAEFLTARWKRQRMSDS